MRPTCALSYAARVGLRANDSDPRHVPGKIARVRPLLRPAARSQGRCLLVAHCPHCFSRRFSRGVILIGALSKGLRLPLLRESGRLRQKRTRVCGCCVLVLHGPASPRERDARDSRDTLGCRHGRVLSRACGPRGVDLETCALRSAHTDRSDTHGHLLSHTVL